jgi:dihydrofolate reductase
LFVTPILVGDGTPFFPHGSRVNLTLRDEHRFDDGTMHLHYLVTH